MNAWSLPKTATVGGEEYAINADYRDILEIIGYLTDDSRPEFIRWQIALGLFYEKSIPPEHQGEAMQALADFISYGAKGNCDKKLLDWQQDATLIVADVNKVAGHEVRSLPFLHWWTFLSYFNGIGEGQLSTVVSIRSKLAKGQKLEKWEREYYLANRDTVELVDKDTVEVKRIKAEIYAMFQDSGEGNK